MLTSRASYLMSLLCILLLAACQEFEPVEVLEPEPVFCVSDDAVNGRWLTDSVHITFEFAANDCTVVNTRPGLVYDLQVSCNNSTGLAQLSFSNFAGLSTIVGRSTNFAFTNSTLYFLGLTQTLQDTAFANLQLNTNIVTDSLIHMTYRSDQPADGTVQYDLFLARSE